MLLPPPRFTDSHKPNHPRSRVHSVSCARAQQDPLLFQPSSFLLQQCSFSLYLPTEFLSFFQSLPPALFPLKRPAGNDLQFNSLKSPLSIVLIRSKVNTTMGYLVLTCPLSLSAPPPTLSLSQSKDMVWHFCASQWRLTMRPAPKRHFINGLWMVIVFLTVPVHCTPTVCYEVLKMSLFEIILFCIRKCFFM